MKKVTMITRFYNKIKVNGKRVIKTAPKERFDNEIRWFGVATKLVPDCVPKIYKTYESKSTYEMQRIYGSNFYEWVLDSRGDDKKVVEAFNHLLRLVKNDLHRSCVLAKSEDIREMYFNKPQKSLEWFAANIEAFPKKMVINNREVVNPLYLLGKKYNQFEKRLKNTTYSFIHGDLTWSNTLIDSKNRFYFIDPRGCFGNTKIYGDVRYDIAKLYYSAVGNFDSLNVGKFKYHRETDCHYYSIDSNGYEFLGDKVISFFKEERDIIKFIHATIWLSLLPHVSNDKKMLYAVYAHGSYLLNDLNV